MDEMEGLKLIAQATCKMQDQLLLSPATRTLVFGVSKWKQTGLPATEVSKSLEFHSKETRDCTTCNLVRIDKGTDQTVRMHWLSNVFVKALPNDITYYSIKQEHVSLLSISVLCVSDQNASTTAVRITTLTVTCTTLAAILLHSYYPMGHPSFSSQSQNGWWTGTPT